MTALLLSLLLTQAAENHWIEKVDHPTEITGACKTSLVDIVKADFPAFVSFDNARWYQAKSNMVAGAIESVRNELIFTTDGTKTEMMALARTGRTRPPVYNNTSEKWEVINYRPEPVVNPLAPLQTWFIQNCLNISEVNIVLKQKCANDADGKLFCSYWHVKAGNDDEAAASPGFVRWAHDHETGE